MNDDLDDTERQWRDSLARWLADQDVTLGAAPDAATLWRGLARDLGLCGVGLPEAAGGLGGGLRAHLLALATLGGWLRAEPYLSTALVAGGLLQGAAGAPLAAAWLPRVADGAALLAWAHAEPGARGAADDVACALRRAPDGWRLSGAKASVVTAAQADALLVSARLDDAEANGLAVVLLDAAAPGLARTPVPLLDGSLAADLRFDDVAVPDGAVLYRGAAAQAAIERALDDATLGHCAEALGVMQRLLADTLAHVRERRQFGVPIASFQALQHRLADMHLAHAQAEALTWAVADRLQDGGATDGTTGEAEAADRALAVSSAKLAVDRALRAVGQGAVQLHGAMGVTEELAVGRYFRRATQLERLDGASARHLRRIDRLQG